MPERKRQGKGRAKTMVATNHKNRATTRANSVMVRAGYVPAVRVAEALEKSLPTVHRVCENNDIETLDEGRVLYVKLPSLIKFYADTPPLRDALTRLLDTMAKEAAEP